MTATRWPLLALLVALAPGVAPAQIAISVDAAAGRRPIDPDVYGIHYSDDAAFANEIRQPHRRWGGNDSSRYNWTINAFNNGFDYYFENNPRGYPSADQYVQLGLATGTRTIVTMPLLGYVAKDTSSCGFSIARYGAQQDSDPFRPDCGNGVYPGGALVAGVDPLDAGLPVGPAFVTDWVEHLVETFGSAAEGGVALYSLDNEPGLWHETHRDAHPAPLSYTEIRDKGIAAAAAIKAVDPGAFVLGPVQDGWTRYFFASYQTWEQADGDRQQNGGLDFLPWYLQQMKAYEDAHGTRLLDYLDVHFYPQNGVTLRDAGDASLQALRLRSTRALWDPTYVDESWIAQAGPDGGIVRLVPRLREWIDAYYPGTKIAITEYNWGGLESLNGALAQADVLGIFGREGVDLATLFDTEYSSGAFTPSSPAAFAFRIYRSYDGRGGAFGETSVAAASSAPEQVSVYAAQRDADGALTIVLINKTGAAIDQAVALAGAATGVAARVFRYDGANLGQIVQQPDVPLAAGSFTAALPARSITLVEVPEPARALGGLAAFAALLGRRLRRRLAPLLPGREQRGRQAEQDLVDERDRVGHHQVHEQQRGGDREQRREAQPREPRHQPADDQRARLHGVLPRGRWSRIRSGVTMAAHRTGGSP
jgi:hypothetical protein